MAPNLRWVSYITAVRTGQGWLHLAVVLDLFSRRLVGGAMQAALNQELVRETLVRTLKQTALELQDPRDRRRLQWIAYECLEQLPQIRT